MSGGCEGVRLQSEGAHGVAECEGVRCACCIQLVVATTHLTAVAYGWHLITGDPSIRAGSCLLELSYVPSSAMQELLQKHLIEEKSLHWRNWPRITDTE